MTRKQACLAAVRRTMTETIVLPRLEIHALQYQALVDATRGCGGNLGPVEIEVEVETETWSS